MHIDIQSRGFRLTQGLRDYTERRLRFAFGATQAGLERIAIRLTDVNGPRGGEDKRCRIQVSIRGASAVSIEDTESDLYVAIERAVDRAGRTVARRLARLRQDRRIVPFAPADYDGGPGAQAA
jgi:ribosome-associated translation inhibitor RaiA